MPSWQTHCRKVSGSKVRDWGGAGSLVLGVRPWSPIPCCLVLTGDREALWAELKAGAESGWDFSSRWLVGGPDPTLLSSIRTSKFVPVDLNAFLCQAEELMSNFYSRLGECTSGRGGEGVLAQLVSYLSLGCGAGSRTPSEGPPASWPAPYLTARAGVQMEPTLLSPSLSYWEGLLGSVRGHLCPHIPTPSILSPQTIAHGPVGAREICTASALPGQTRERASAGPEGPTRAVAQELLAPGGQKCGLQVCMSPDVRTSSPRGGGQQQEAKVDLFLEGMGPKVRYPGCST